MGLQLRRGSVRNRQLQREQQTSLLGKLVSRFSMAAQGGYLLRPRLRWKPGPSQRHSIAFQRAGALYTGQLDRRLPWTAVLLWGLGSFQYEQSQSGRQRYDAVCDGQRTL